jgi:hypothetical protein
MVPILADTLVAPIGIHTHGMFVTNVQTLVGTLIDILTGTSNLRVADLALALSTNTH